MFIRFFKNIINKKEDKKSLSIRILEKVCAFYNIPQDEIIGKKRR